MCVYIYIYTHICIYIGLTRDPYLSVGTLGAT